MGETLARTKTGPRRLALVLSLSLPPAMLASGCALFDSAADDGEIATATTVEAETTTTVEATTSGSEETLAGDGDTDDSAEGPAEATDPVPVDAPLDVVLAIVEDMHGPTDDVSGQMNRLVRYPMLPTPEGAHLAGLYARGVPVFDDDTKFELWSEADFYADGTTDDLIVFYETQLPPLGWNITKKASDTRFDGAPITELEFELPNSNFRLTESLTVTIVEDPDLPELLVETRYLGGDTDDRSYFDALSGWFDPALVPEGGELRSIIVDTAAGEGRTTLTIDNEFRYPEGTADADLLADIADLGASAGLDQVETSRDDVVSLENPELDKFQLSVFAGSTYTAVTVEADTKFVNEEVDGAEIVAETKPTDPVPDFASPPDIETIVAEIHGPTIDIATQMNRLTPFPAVPTPIGSSVVDLTASIGTVIGDDDVLSHLGAVQFEVNGTKEDTLLFFDTQIAALGWTEASRSDESEDDGLTTKTIVEYSIPGAEVGIRPPFKLEVTDDVDKADVIVDWTYYEYRPRDQSFTDRWLGWQGEIPLPDGGEIHALRISTNGIFGQAIFLSAEYDYDEIGIDDLRGRAEGLVAASDYGPGEEGAVESRLYLTHPVFTDAYIGFFELGDSRTRVDLSTQRPFG